MKKIYDNSAWNKLVLERQNSNHGYDAVNRDYTSLQLSAMRTIGKFYGVRHIYDTYLVDGFVIYVVADSNQVNRRFTISPLGVYSHSVVPDMSLTSIPVKQKKQSSLTQLNLFK